MYVYDISQHRFSQAYSAGSYATSACGIA